MVRTNAQSIFNFLSRAVTCTNVADTPLLIKVDPVQGLTYPRSLIRVVHSTTKTHTRKGNKMSRTDTLAQNIRDAWNAASDDQKARGAVWYQVANQLAEMVGNGDVRKGAGIISALSPRMKWDRNMALATDAMNGNVHGAMGASLRKVQAILDGADPESVLPMTAKTGHFYRNIVDPTDTDYVTVDCWAYRVATCEWDAPGPKSAKDYREVADAYRMVASELGMISNHVQAGTWNWARETEH